MRKIKISLLLFCILTFLISGYDWFHQILTFEQYKFLVIAIVFIHFEWYFILKHKDSVGGTLEAIKGSTSFKIYKKEEKYLEDKDFYYRSIPFEGDLFKTFWLAYQYGLIKNRTHLLNACLLKWLKEDRIRFSKKGTYEICSSNLEFDNLEEKSLFDYLQNTSHDGFIRITIWNAKKIFLKIDSILLQETAKFRGEEKLIRIEKEDYITPLIKEDLDCVFGFRRFLLNFGDFQNKNPQEVKVWEDYFIYAELFNISREVKEEFTKAHINYPYQEQGIKNLYLGILHATSFFTVLSFLLIGVLVVGFTSPLWQLYSWLTWSFFTFFH